MTGLAARRSHAWPATRDRTAACKFVRRDKGQGSFESLAPTASIYRNRDPIRPKLEDRHVASFPSRLPEQNSFRVCRYSGATKFSELPFISR